MTTVQNLIGTWRAIEGPFNPGEQVFYVFNTAGDLTITFRTKDGTQYVFLTYNLEGNTLITNQPSAPKIEKSMVQTDGDTMIIDHQGVITRLKKESPNH